MIRRIASLVGPLLALLASTAPGLGAQTWPTNGWPTATPQAVGLNAAVLDSIDAEIRSGRYGAIDRMLVIRRGRVAYDRTYRQNYDSIYGDSARKKGPLNPHDLGSPYNYFNPWWHPYYRRGDLHSLQSVTKTITSVIIGTAVMQGRFPSLDTPVLSFFDEANVANVDDRKRRMTIRHLLTMTPGLDWNENLPYADPNNTAIVMEGSYDWLKFTIDRPMSEEPGTRFNYNSGATQLLAHVFRRATGTDIEEWAARHLFAPLGIERWFWKRTPAGVVDTEGGLYLEARDVAKIWYLFMRNGSWNGRQIVSPEWVRTSVTPAVAVANRPGGARYGLKWWLYANPSDTSRLVWAGSGFGGQVPIAIPEDDMIVMFNGWNILPGQRGLPAIPTLGRILKAVTDRRAAAEPPEPFRPGIRFDAATLRPGARVGSLVVESVNVQRTPIDSSYVGTVRFRGEVELSGATMRNPDADAATRVVCFEADSASAARLPRWREDERRAWFCFDNQQAARRALGPPSEGVRATVVVDRFTTHRMFTDAVNSARLVRAVRRPR